MSAKYSCPKCPYIYTAPIPVVDVTHHCSAVGKRLVSLVRHVAEHCNVTPVEAAA